MAIDDTHNTWTNVIVKMTILRLLGSSDDKEKMGVARPEGPPWNLFDPKDSKIEETVKNPSQKDQDRNNLLAPVEPTIGKFYSSVQWTEWSQSQLHAPDEPTIGKMKASVQWTQKLRLGFITG